MRKAISKECQNQRLLDRQTQTLGLSELLQRLPGELSGGQRQRVAIGRALLPHPGLILADEPTGNLDPPNKTRILDLLFEQAEASKATLVMVTHDHALLDRFEQMIDFETFHAREAADA